MALPFLRGETEENATQTLAFVSIVVVTIGLAIFNVCGAIAGSQSDNMLEIVIRGAFGLVITGAEFLAAVALVRVMLAKNMLRKVVGTVIFIGLAWVCIQNGKRAAHLIFPEFQTSATLLEEQAKIAGNQESERVEAQGRALEAAPALLAKVQDDLAETQRKQRLLQAQSPEKIEEMQQMLISEGYYFFRVDGRIGPETERAMRSMGEDLRNDISRLEDQESRLMTGLTTVQVSEPQSEGEGLVVALTPAAQQAILNDQARQARQAAIWIEIMLWVVEGARSFGLWALVTTVTARSAEDEEEARRRSEAAKKGWETRKAKEDDLQITDDGWWIERLVKALNTHHTKHTVKGMCDSYFGKMPAGELREHLKRQIDKRVELPKVDPVKHKRAIERGLLSSQRPTYLMQQHIDFIHGEGEYAPQPEQAENGHDQSPPLNGADDADGQDPINHLPA